MSTPVPFSHDPWNDKNQDTYIANSGAYNQGVTDATNQSSDETRGLEKEQYNKSKSELDPNAGKNIAQGQGQYGMINNRNYAKTLKLAREADAYNNKPQEHIVRVGSVFGSGIQDMDTGYDRPKIQTMETRAMDQSFQLDTNQKQLAQALQDAVNHKDLNAFIKTYAQLYGIILDKQQAMVTMRQLERQAQISNTMQKYQAQWLAEFTRAFNAETVAVINDLQADPIFQNYLAWMLTGGAAPQQEQYVEQAFLNEYYKKNGWRFGWNGVGPVPVKLHDEAQIALYKEFLPGIKEYEKTVKRGK